MPEDFSSLLEALAAEGRGLARPVPLGVIEAGGRVRRRRRRQVTATTSGLAACAVAAGVAVGFGSSGGGSGPVRPGTSSTSPSAPAAPASSASRPPSQSQIAIDTSHFLQNDEAPNPGAFQWKIDVAFTSAGMGVEFGLCGSQVPDAPPKLHAMSEDLVQFRTPNGSENAFESIFHYASGETALADYVMIKPDPSKCSGGVTGRVTGTVPNGYAWVQWRGPSADHVLIVRSGDKLAYWRYREDGVSGTAYDTADDQLALQRMADRLDGRIPVPAKNTAPPPNAIPDAAWLDPAQIPFGTADQSHGWYQMGKEPPTLGQDVPGDLCPVADQDIASTADSMIASHMFHGTPTETPLDPKSGYLYSGASQDIATFPSAESAATAFARAKGLMSLHGCTFRDSSGHSVTRTIKVGAVTPSGSGFSIQVDDTLGPSHSHVYYVVKGDRVSCLVVYFRQGDNTTAGDAAVLAAMGARLP